MSETPTATEEKPTSLTEKRKELHTQIQGYVQERKHLSAEIKTIVKRMTQTKDKEARARQRENIASHRVTRKNLSDKIKNAITQIRSLKSK